MGGASLPPQSLQTAVALSSEKSAILGSAGRAKACLALFWGGVAAPPPNTHSPVALRREVWRGPSALGSLQFSLTGCTLMPWATVSFPPLRLHCRAIFQLRHGGHNVLFRRARGNGLSEGAAAHCGNRNGGKATRQGKRQRRRAGGCRHCENNETTCSQKRRKGECLGWPFCPPCERARPPFSQCAVIRKEPPTTGFFQTVQLRPEI